MESGHENITVEELSQMKVMNYIPVFVYDGLLAVIGFFGNSLVLYVFGFKFKKTSTTNYFVIGLGFYDFITCTVGLPFDMYDLSRPYVFDNPVLCKTFRFITTFSTLTSCVILVIISIDRYRKICRIEKKQWFPRHALRWCVIASIVCFILAIPTLIMYGTRVKDTEVPGIKGLDCTIMDEMRKTKYPVIYNGLLLLSFIVNFGLMVTLYIFIGRKAIKHRRAFKPSTENKENNRSNNTPNKKIHSTEESFDQRDTSTISRYNVNRTDKEYRGVVRTLSRMFTKKPRPATDSSDEIAVEDELEIPSRLLSQRLSNKRDSFSCGVMLDDNNRPEVIVKQLSTESDKSVPKTPTSTKSSKSRLFKSNIAGSLRTTGMLFAITLCFFVSCLPYLSISIMKLLKPKLTKNIPLTAKVIYNIFYRSYFLNSAINPIIYGYFNKNFRSECRKIFSRTCGCHCSEPNKA